MSRTCGMVVSALLAATLMGCVLPQDKGKRKESEWRPDKVTGVVVDIRHCPRLTILSPRIIDEKDLEVFGPMDVQLESNEFRGMFGRAETLLGALHHKRVGDRPLLIHALGIRPIGQEIIVGREDARRLRLVKKLTKVLQKGRVVLLTGR